jgi:hypothetical protein
MGLNFYLDELTLCGNEGDADDIDIFLLHIEECGSIQVNVELLPGIILDIYFVTEKEYVYVHELGHHLISSINSTIEFEQVSFFSNSLECMMDSLIRYILEDILSNFLNPLIN